MGDILDRASELEEFHLQAALASRPRPAPAYSISATICDDCGSEIPPSAPPGGAWV
ncbi:TraR/DksA family transcriptional regulator [Pseudomonas aeruginosa]|uniref:TraR/DksA family transcriptional regulator n=1 Tax=Pseudomonas aeruginosa TaxID=287 RepID=UPI002A247DD5|nr:TraR/DksA family transcriptional regulator [Pseudomonas aeruginosa]